MRPSHISFGLLLASSAANGSTVTSHNATLHRRNSISKYGGCDTLYRGKTGRSIVDTAYKDMLRLVQNVDPFLMTTHREEDGIHYDFQPPSELENRFFGTGTIGNTWNGARKLIATTFENAANWYVWWFDWPWAHKIEVYCEEDQPNSKSTTCSTVRDGSTPIAYAVNYEGKSKIVFCSRFFRLSSLDEVKELLDTNPIYQHDLDVMGSTGQAFFHEMTHLAVVEGVNQRVIEDLTENPVDKTGKTAYGPNKAETLAQRFPDYAWKNADNYAIYATARWFAKIYGSPNPSSADNPTGPNDIEFSDDFADDGSNSTDVGYSDYTYDDMSSDEAVAFAAGDYTPSGWLIERTLRILPLGDSITNGYQSTDGNGYRNDLYNLLVNANNSVDLVGSVQAGTMADNYNEGHNGATIAQIATFTAAYGKRPNVVLLHAGTNDLNLPSDPAGAPARLDSLVGQLLNACPDATILVARIIPSTNAGTQTLIPTFNNAITDLMLARARQGQHVLVVDMPSAVTTADLFDGLHPNDGGYNKMALKWAISLTAANDLGWIKDPVPERNNLVLCNHDPTWLPQGQIASGGGLGSSLWTTANCISNPINGGGCDCEAANPPAAVTSALLSSSNACDIKTLTYPLTSAVHFVDLNGDGRAEYLWVDGAGGVTAFLNLGGPDNGPNAAKVSWLPQGVIATGVGANRANVQFADLNGDGRAEYLWVHDDGSVDCWLNLGGPDNGPNAAKVGWLPQGTIATGIGKDGAGVRFADLNGDGRAEYLYVNTDGSVEAYLNLGGPDNGPNAAKVGWLPQGIIATGVGQGRDNVVFADMNGDGRADYVAVSQVDGSAMLWLNGGGPDNGPNAAKVVWYPHGTIATGDGSGGRGIQLADLNGDGRAEYLHVGLDSSVTTYLNGC